MTKTSFRNMFRSSDIERIEIPIIQRDFAQGRQNPEVKRIRRSFLDVLKQAVTGDNEISLDFVYGDTKGGRFVPLDGQQRLTSLYLLHWYLAVRCNVPENDRSFLKNFTYHTRFSSRDFCAKLASTSPELAGQSISMWLGDQYWFAGSWRKDPSIQSMLVVLDDIQALFDDLNDETCEIAWKRLTAEANPSITFEILSLKEMGLTDELYIKMNSRGKPLTDFEHFKAQFEQVLREFEDKTQTAGESISRYTEFTQKIDREWADLIWPFRGISNNADDEFLRLFRFITDITIWRHGVDVEASHEDLEATARSVYGDPELGTSTTAQAHLFSVLDNLHREFGSAASMEDIDGWFARIFANAYHVAGRVTIFGETNLLADCCKTYGPSQGRVRAFSLAKILLLHSVIEYTTLDVKPSQELLADRMRCLRNVIFSSQNEIRVEIFSALLGEVSAFVASGDVGILKSFNRAQVEEELAKSSFIESHGSQQSLVEAVQRLEDHDLLRGNLSMFDFTVGAQAFIRRASAFEALFSGKVAYQEISKALLACGDYSQKIAGDRFQFGSPVLPSVWRELFVSRSRPGVGNTKTTLMKLLDHLQGQTLTDIETSLESISAEYIREAKAAKKYDWRYYMTLYPVMRSGKSGIFISASYAMGFDLCMMEQTRLSSYYSDPYIRAATELAGLQVNEHFTAWLYGYDGYELDDRWSVSHSTSRQVIRVSHEGFKLKTSRRAGIQAILDEHGVEGDGGLNIRQTTSASVIWDRSDRIIAGAKLLAQLVEAGI